MLWILLAVVAVIIAVVVVKTLSAKPTQAVTAKIELDNDSARAKEYGEKLSQMIKHETISFRGQQDRTKFLEMHKTLEQIYPNVHKHCEKTVLNGSLLFKWQGTGETKPVLFMSHHDVVEAGGSWEHEPFSGDIDADGKVWGRGTVDTKASLSCMLQAVEELIAEGYTPKCDVYIASSCTEEWSGDGAPATVEYLKSKGVHLEYLMDEGGMILEEPVGGVKGLYAMVGVVEKGYGDVKFVAKSNGGHASAPTKNTPLVRLGKFMADVEKNYPFRSEMSPTVREMFRRMTPNMSFAMKMIFSNLWLFEKLLLRLLPSISSAAGAMVRTTLAFTTAKGSDGYNVLPQEAYVTGNMRFIPHQDADESIRIISDFAKKYDIESEVIYYDKSCPVVSFDSNPFHLVEQVSAKVYPGVQVCPYTMTGGTDAKFYRDLTDNALRFAPLYIDKQQYGSIHALNENIYQGALPFAVDFYKEMIKNS
ncbi:MAG: M20/M25/M40 family metallo-hydrolase [Oscillospiraceae bacterium]|nr:M20/M25/M40 family metallo-hydrolase [Oscillospiraceae bacterium]